MVYDMIQQLAIVDEDVLDLLGIDTIEMGRGFVALSTSWKEWELPDGSPCLIPDYVDVRRTSNSKEWTLYSPSGKACGIQREGMIYFEQIAWPYQEGVPRDLGGLAETMINAMWSIPIPPNLAATDLESLGTGASRLRESTNRAITFIFGGNLLEMATFLCGIETFMMLMATEKQTTHRLLDAITEVHLGNLERYLGAVGPYVDIVLFGDDLGTQVGPQMSPAMYREYFKPRHHVLWTRAKSLANVKVQLHCCGGIRPLLNDLIEAGLDAINPVQTSAVGMDPAELKRDFGDRICFWGGGCDTQRVLPSSSPEQIRNHVRNRLEILSPGGGFVFQQVHNIMANVPPQNITAMFNAVAEFNRG